MILSAVVFFHKRFPGYFKILSLVFYLRLQ